MGVQNVPNHLVESPDVPNGCAKGCILNRFIKYLSAYFIFGSLMTKAKKSL